MIPKRRRLSFILHLIVVTLAGAGYILFMWNSSIKATEEHALELARTAEASFQIDVIKQLNAIPEDIGTTEYEQLKNSLMKIVEINQEIKFTYLYTIKEGIVYFMVDSEPASSEDYSPPGQVYSEADAYTFQAFEEEYPITTNPATDRGGTWVSVLVPKKDYASGKTVAVFGMDYPADWWYQNTIMKTIQSLIIVICILLLYIMIHLIIKKNGDLKAEKNKLSEINRKLSEKEELFRALFEQSPYGISFGGANSNIIDANFMFEKIVGRSKEDLAKLHWTHITHQDDIEKDLEQYSKFKKGEINDYTIRKRYLRPDSSIVWVNMTIAPIKLENNDYINHICIVEDITELIWTEISLQESERSNAMLLSNLPGMAYRCDYDKNWTMQFVSEGCYELTGYRPESLLKNRELTFNDLISTEFQDVLWEKWTKVLMNRSVFKEEYSITTANQEVKWIYEQGQGVYNEKGEVIAIEGMIIDISDRKKREDEILYLNYHDVLTGLYNRRYFEDAKKELDHKDKYPLSVIIGDINGLKLINSAIGHGEGDKLILQMAEILKSCCREGDILARTGGDEFSILLPNTKYEIADKIVNQINRLCEESKKKTQDEAYHVSISVGCATKTEEEDSLTSMIKAAEESMYRHKLLQNKSLHSSIISSMKTSLYEKSQETEEHAHRLIELSKAIGQSLNLVEEQFNQLELLSTLHDIGKIGISDNILNKPGKLTDEEWFEMKRHPEMGYRIAMSTPELAPIADYILNHHERWDGKGYPYGKKGEEIPLLSRIIAVADAYDAMTSDRPYRKAMDKNEALEEIRRNAGTQFDPTITEIFIEKVINEQQL